MESDGMDVTLSHFGGRMCGIIVVYNPENTTLDGAGGLEPAWPLSTLSLLRRRGPDDQSLYSVSRHNFLQLFYKFPPKFFYNESILQYIWSNFFNSETRTNGSSCKTVDNLL
jgi:hypothetical protein